MALATIKKAKELLARYQAAARCKVHPGYLMFNDCPCEVCTLYRDSIAFYNRRKDLGRRNHADTA